MADKDFSIGLKSIKEISFKNKLSEDILANYNQKNIDLKLGFSVNGDEKLEIVSINVFVSYIYNVDKGKSKEFFELETETTFKFKNLTPDSERLKIADDVVAADDDLMRLFLQTSIGATRGMVAYKMASLPIHLVLPLVNPDKLIQLNNNVIKSPSKKGK